MKLQKTAMTPPPPLHLTIKDIRIQWLIWLPMLFAQNRKFLFIEDALAYAFISSPRMIAQRSLCLNASMAKVWGANIREAFMYGGYFLYVEYL